MYLLLGRLRRSVCSPIRVGTACIINPVGSSWHTCHRGAFWGMYIISCLSSHSMDPVPQPCTTRLLSQWACLKLLNLAKHVSSLCEPLEGSGSWSEYLESLQEGFCAVNKGLLAVAPCAQGQGEVLRQTEHYSFPTFSVGCGLSKPSFAGIKIIQ